ncbi:MAG: ABC transporter ATP-binding protein [Lachnospiraceae bacterium]|jgi:ABC-2 type transport system ATP-binding protein|nr:ABC transporter ATP-binding protein [Lachnospiraceae bacterium]
MVQIDRLCKSYGSFRALDELNLSIEKGELFGFVGPNGAGKTTTMRIISGLLRADSGTVMVGGIDARRDTRHLKEKIGYMPDFFGVYDNLKALEYMEFFASIYGIEGREARKLCLELMDLVNLGDKADSYVDGLSRGMKQRLCLARSLVHNPELLILDEPASGLDPRARFEMKGILRNLSEMGKTIIVSSHILPELAEMCTTIGIIEHGKMMVSGTVNSIMAGVNRQNPLIIRVVGELDTAVRLLKESPMVENLSMSEQELYVSLQKNVLEENPLQEEEKEAALLTTLIQGGVRISSYTREKGNLESVFMQITEEQEGEE